MEVPVPAGGKTDSLLSNETVNFKVRCPLREESRPSGKKVISGAA